MRAIDIANNRFGLGARPDAAPISDARKWLLEQLDRYDARPPAIAAAPPQAAAANRLVDYYQAGRMKQQQRRSGSDMAGREPERRPKPRPERKRGRGQRANGDMAKAADADNPADLSANSDMRSAAMQLQQAERAKLRDIYMVSVAARARSALLTNTPFAERLVHFWSNHFAISADKPPVLAMAGSFEFDAIRPHIMGNFGQMLAAVERHPAMLTFLDQAQSIGPDSPAGQRIAANGRARGLNENLAREILELHTLGVRSGYTQNDVTEFARALTGWTVSGLGGGLGGGRAQRSLGGRPGSFGFAPLIHEPGNRSILGRSFAQNGEAQAQAVLDMLAVDPATARNIATKLARHFVADTPPAALVARLEQAFIQSGGDLPMVYRALIDAPEAWSPVAAKFKTPWEWAISAVRAVGGETLPMANVQGFFTQLGQPIWRPGSPAGYDDLAASWAGPDALMRRVEVAERLASRTASISDARNLADRLFGDGLSPPTRMAVERAETTAQAIALLLVSPEFMRR